MGLNGIYYCFKTGFCYRQGYVSYVPERLHKLLKQINDNLKHSNTTEFVFDKLSVRAKRGEQVTILIYLPQ